MATPTLQQVEDYEEDITNVGTFSNDSGTVTLRNGTTIDTLRTAVAGINLLAPVAYSAASTYTLSNQPVTESGVLYRPIIDELPIGPEAFDSAKWAIVQQSVPDTDGVSNASTVTGATSSDALENLDAAISALGSDDIANGSTVTGVGLTAALETLKAALGSDGVANDSTVAGAAVSDALEALDAAITALGSDDLANDSTVSGTTISDAIETLAAATSAATHVVSPKAVRKQLTAANTWQDSGVLTNGVANAVCWIAFDIEQPLDNSTFFARSSGDTRDPPTDTPPIYTAVGFDEDDHGQIVGHSTSGSIASGVCVPIKLDSNGEIEVRSTELDSVIVMRVVKVGI